MGYSRDVKRRAMCLYGEGKNIEQVTAILRAELRINVAVSTVHAWRDAEVPDNWDNFRKGIEEKAIQADADRLVRERRRISSRHYDDLEAMRGVVKHSLFEVEQRNGQKVAVPRKGLKARDVRDGVAAYKDVLTSQRLVLGMATDKVETSTVKEEAGGVRVFLPAEEPPAEPPEVKDLKPEP